MRRDLPTLHAIQVFEAAAHHLSFTAAAPALNVQQPAVSRQIAMLEAELGTPLFSRRRPKLELTEAGRQLLAATREGLDLIEQAARDIRGASGARRVRVNTSIGFASCWLISRLPDFRRDHPDIEVILTTRDLDPDFAFDDTDIVVRFGDGRWPETDCQLLFPEAVIPVCSPSYLASAGGPFDAAGLARQRLLHFDDGYYHWFNWARLFADSGLEHAAVHSGTRFNSFIVLVQAALNGEGVALGWRYMMDDYLTRNALVPASNMCLRSDRGYFCLTRKSRPATEPAAQFVDWITAKGRAAVVEG